MFKRFFYWAYFRGSLFSEGLIIGGNFAFQNGLNLAMKTASINCLWAYLRQGLLSKGYLRLRCGGLIFIILLCILFYFILFYFIFYFLFFIFYFFLGGGAYYRNFAVYDFHIFTLSSSSFTGILCIHTMTTLSWLVSSSGKSAAPVLQRSWVQICNC